MLTMNTWITLLRGINVGGKNIVPMKELRELLESIGLVNVRTYIQSGNCVYEAGGRSTSTSASASVRSANVHSKKIAKAISEHFGFEPTVLTLSAQQLSDALTQNPFSIATEDLSKVHLFFLAKKAANADMQGIEALGTASEQFKLTDGVFYLFAPDVAVTARNLRTVIKLLAMVE